MPPIRRILVLAVDGAESLDVLGPVEVFEYAGARGARRVSDRRGRPGHRRPDHDGQRPAARRRAAARTRRRGTTRSSSPAARARAARSGTRRSSTGSRAPRAARGARRRSAPARTCWPRRACWTGGARRRIGSTATALAERYPAVRLDPDPVFVRDGDVWTSAGVTAGIDLALALVEDDLGPEVALTVARLLVVFLKRPGGQSQFSGALSVQQASRPALRELQAWIAGHLDEDLSVAALADRARPQRALVRPRLPGRGRPDARRSTSRRCASSAPALFWRTAPSRWRRWLAPPGFSSAEVLRRAFHRRVGVSPAAYRERFRLAA